MMNGLYLTGLTILVLALAVNGHENQPQTDEEDDNLFGSINLFGESVGINNVFNWVFGDPEDEKHQQHEMDEHFGYLRGSNNDNDLVNLAKEVGIKAEFFNFKAHDYDNNDKIDGLELLSMIVNEKSHHSKSPHNQADAEKDFKMSSKIIDQLLQTEDANNDGYLDFNEYASARKKLRGARA